MNRKLLKWFALFIFQLFFILSFVACDDADIMAEIQEDNNSSEQEATNKRTYNSLEDRLFIELAEKGFKKNSISSSMSMSFKRVSVIEMKKPYREGTLYIRDYSGSGVNHIKIPFPTQEELRKSSYIYLGEGNDGKEAKCAYFMRDKMTIGYYSEIVEKSKGSGYFVEDLLDWKGMLNGQDYYYVESADDVLDYTPVSREPYEEPLIKIVCSIKEGYTEEEFLKTVEEYGLKFAYRGTVQKMGGNFYRVQYSLKEGSFLTITFSPKGTIIESSYEDVQIITRRSVEEVFYSADMPHYYPTHSKELVGHYLYNDINGKYVSYKSGEDAIKQLFPQN